MNVVPVLKRCEVFVGLDDKALEKIARLTTWQKANYKEGDFIFKENIAAKKFYILEEGEVRLIIDVYREGIQELVQVPVQVPVDTITKGDVFGWSSLVAPHSLTLSAICIKPSSVFSVNGIELTLLMDTNHSLGYEVMKGLVRVIGTRLRDLRERFVGKVGIPETKGDNPIE